MKFLQLLLLLGVLWKGEAAVINGDDYALLVLNKDVSCTAVVFKPGWAITHDGCAKNGDDIKVCKRGIDNGKDCDEGASVEVDSILNNFPGVTTIKLKDSLIKPVSINTKELAIGMPCNVIGFGHTQTGFNKEIVSDVPQVFSTTIKDIHKDSIELKMEAPAGICKGDQGGAVVCENQLAGILPEKGACVGSTIKVIPVLNIHQLIAREEAEQPAAAEGGGNGDDKKDNKDAAPHVKESFMTTVLSVITLTLLFH